MRNFILTRGRYISEGYFYFLSYYSRAYEKLFSDDPTRLQFVTSLKNVRGSITLKTYRQGYLYILPSRQNTICQWKRNFSAMYCTILHHLYCQAVLRSYSFLFTASKGIIFFLKTSLNLKHVSTKWPVF